MRRFLTDWPASARAAAGVLSALVVVLAVTTVLTARHHDRTRLSAAGPTTTTTTSPPDAAFLTTLPPATTTSVAKGAEPSSTTTAVFRGVVATTSSTTAPRTTSTLATTSTTAGPGDAYCRAAVTDARPPAGAKDTVNITSTLPGHDVTLVLHYRTSDVTFPAAGQAPFTTDATGKLSVTFDVSQGSKDYPVIIDVAVGGAAASCETNFRPTS